MAGVLPGVEHARRRRCHQRGANTPGFSSTRWSSFCHYTSSHDLICSRSSKQTSAATNAEEDEKLVEIAREAKQRLDERLSAQWKKRSSNNRQQRQGLLDTIFGVGDVQKEVIGLKKSVSKKLSWGKLRWKASEQDECVICLEQLRMGDNNLITQLPCAHKFHSYCLVPWLHSHSHCPCCRMEFLTTPFLKGKR